MARRWRATRRANPAAEGMRAEGIDFPYADRFLRADGGLCPACGVHETEGGGLCLGCRAEVLRDE